MKQTVELLSLLLPSVLRWPFRFAIILSLIIVLTREQLSPGDDLIMSNMYSLLNYIAATSKEIYEATTASINPLQSEHEQTKIHTAVEIGLNGMTEDEKRLAGISTISVVSRLALEYKMEDVSSPFESLTSTDFSKVTKLTISMLLQRLRSAEPTVEAAIAYNLVDLALAAPEGSFVDIVRAFSSINRSANPEDPRFSNNMVRLCVTCIEHARNGSARSWPLKQDSLKSSIELLHYTRSTSWSCLVSLQTRV